MTDFFGSVRNIELMNDTTTDELKSLEELFAIKEAEETNK